MKMKLRGSLNDMNNWLKISINKLITYEIREDIKIIEKENEVLKRTLNFRLQHGKHMYLDGEVIDKETFEFVREALPEETEMFYQIRLNELKIKELKGKLPENEYLYNKFVY